MLDLEKALAYVNAKLTAPEEEGPEHFNNPERGEEGFIRGHLWDFLASDLSDIPACLASLPETLDIQLDEGGWTLRNQIELMIVVAVEKKLERRFSAPFVEPTPEPPVSEKTPAAKPNWGFDLDRDTGGEKLPF